MTFSTPFPRRARGFTLIELMIGVVIVGILTAIAVPSYGKFMTKSRRSTAQTFLLEVSQRQQQYLLDTRTYAGTLTALSLTPSAELQKYYTITLSAPAGSPPTFTVTATPRSDSAQRGSETLTLNETGAKTPASVW